MRKLAIVLATVAVAFVSPIAQEPTVPSMLNFTCHGYDEGVTRAYNCIPAAGHEGSMSTFVPPVGSSCNGGRIDEFPAGRLVFQIRCQVLPVIDLRTALLNERVDGLEAVRRLQRPAQHEGGTWSVSGSGPSVIPIPDGVRTIKIHGEYRGRGENFVVWCGLTGNSGGLLVNEILGTGSDYNTTYDGVHTNTRSYSVRGQPDVDISPSCTRSACPGR